MYITVDTITPSPSGLRLGCTWHAAKEGPIRFLQIHVEFDLFTPEVRKSLLRSFNDIEAGRWDDELQEPLF